MRTEYGYRTPNGLERWCKDRDQAIFLGADLPGFALIARDVSDTRVVSIRG